MVKDTKLESLLNFYKHKPPKMMVLNLQYFREMVTTFLVIANFKKRHSVKFTFKVVRFAGTNIFHAYK